MCLNPTQNTIYLYNVSAAADDDDDVLGWKERKAAHSDTNESCSRLISYQKVNTILASLTAAAFSS